MVILLKVDGQLQNIIEIVITILLIIKAMIMITIIVIIAIITMQKEKLDIAEMENSINEKYKNSFNFDDK